jgi:copper chaperone CopZ
MSARCLTPYYRKGLIAALIALMAFSANNALADGVPDVQPQKEDSKTSDQEADKANKASDEASAPSTAALPAEASAEPAYHRLTLRLSGSMCAACLKDLQDKLLKVSGIDKVKIDRPNTNYFQAVSPDVSAWAQSIIIYDEHRLALENIRGAIKQQGYHSYRIVDKPMDHKPDEKDLKF